MILWQLAQHTDDTTQRNVYHDLCSHEMESRSYKELQALAKLHGIRANLSKAALIDKLGSLGDELHQNAQDSSSRSQDNAEKHQADSDAPERNSGKPRDEADTPTNDSDTPEGNANQTRLVDSEPQDAETVPCTATADAAHDRVDDTDVALPDPVKPEVPVENSERRQSERPSTAKKEGPTPVDPVETEVPVESSARRKSDRLSAAAKKVNECEDQQGGHTVIGCDYTSGGRKMPS